MGIRGAFVDKQYNRITKDGLEAGLVHANRDGDDSPIVVLVGPSANITEIFKGIFGQGGKQDKFKRKWNIKETYYMNQWHKVLEESRADFDPDAPLGGQERSYIWPNSEKQFILKTDIIDSHLEDDCNTVFYLVFESDELSSKYASYIIEKGARFSTPRTFEVAGYWHVNDNCNYVIKRNLHLAPNQQEPSQWANIIQAIDITRNVSGDYVEIGVYKGSSAKVAYDYYNILGEDAKCYFLDTYAGFNYQSADDSSDCSWKGTHMWESSPEDWMFWVDAHIDDCPFTPPGSANYELIVSNICTQDMPPEIKQISVCNIDVDMYDAVLAALKKCHPLMSSGGIMIVQDAGITPHLIGARCALQEFLGEYGNLYTPVYLQSSGQTYLIKK